MSNPLEISSKYFALIKETIPYDHQVEILLPLLQRLGFSQQGAEAALKEWALQDQIMLYWMGCCGTEDLEAFWCLVQAGRLLCGINRTGALQLLEEAVRLIKKKHSPKQREADARFGFDGKIVGLPPVKGDSLKR
jgi:hypothetical protein